jgi:hypothetical protein
MIEGRILPLMHEPDYPDPNFQAIISEGHFLRQHGRYEQRGSVWRIWSPSTA